MMEFTLEQREKMRQTKKFKLTNQIWNDEHFNSQKYVGCTNYLIKSFFQNTDLSDVDNKNINEWHKYYTTTKNEDIRKSGRDEKELSKLAREFKNKCKEYGLNITLNEAYNYIIIRVIDDTYRGFLKELEAAKYISSTIWPGSTVRTTGTEDIDYNVDLVVSYGDEIIDAYQIKPYSFLYGVQQQKQYCKKALDENLVGHKKYEEKYGIKPVFLIYTGNNNNYIYIDNFKDIRGCN